MPRTYREFVRDKKRRKCKVCQLPAAVKKQLKGRNRKLGGVAVVLEWLAVEWGVTLTKQEWGKHFRELHEPGELAAHNTRRKA